MRVLVEKLAREILIEGLDDWVPIDSLIEGAREFAAPFGVDFRTLSIDALTYLFAEGLAEPGNLGHTGFESIGTTPDALARVIADCERFDWLPKGASHWLSNTEKGDRSVAENR